MPKSFDPDTEIPDLSGKVLVVTGGNAGLGAETVRRLAVHRPANIFLCARTISKANALISEIKAQHSSSATITPIFLDQSSLQSVQVAAKEILSKTDRLDILILNAGIAFTAPIVTADGYEDNFGVNHVSHALLTQLLLPILLKTASSAGSDVRIITVASDAAKVFAPKAGLLLHEVKTDMSSYSPSTRYGQSKLANILFAKSLAQRYPSLKSVSLHPGMVKTEIKSKANGAGWFMYLWTPLQWLGGLTVEEGTKTQLWAATAGEVESGKFFVPIGKADDGSKHAKDQKLIDELWAWTEKELTEHGGPGWPKAE